MKHSRGPWEQGRIHSGEIFSSTDHHRIANCSDNTREEDEQNANARLIAAAPDLLEAVKAVKRDRDEIGLITKETLDCIEKAIAKATLTKEATR